jgi:hypothetical protein
MKHHKAAMHHMKKAHEALAKMHEAHAGREENKSRKHRHAESIGMKKAMHKKHHSE